MNYAEICIIKRDGKREDFSISKIKNAIGKAFHATGINNEEKLIADITMRVISNFTSSTISVEEIQDLVENELMKVRPEVAKKYIIYREWRNTERDRKTQMKHIMDGIVAIDKNDVNLSNANMSSHTPAGQMMTFASEVTKDYTYKYLLPKKFAEAHQLGDIHIHDLDYYPTKTTTCIQYDLDDLFERGFRTKNGSIRTPQSIQSYATLATIIFQTNQNEQHGAHDRLYRRNKCHICHQWNSTCQAASQEEPQNVYDRRTCKADHRGDHRSRGGQFHEKVQFHKVLSWNEWNPYGLRIHNG